jgi:hypothetical protein
MKKSQPRLGVKVGGLVDGFAERPLAIIALTIIVLGIAAIWILGHGSV